MIFFVTGGSRGIGAAIVLEAIGLGHDVAFTYWNHAELADRVVARAREIGPGRRCHAYRLDVRDSAAVESSCVLTPSDDVMASSALPNAAAARSRRGIAASPYRPAM